MQKFRWIVAIVVLCSYARAAVVEDGPYKPTREKVYKRIGSVDLKLEIFDPPKARSVARSPGVVLFFGGGWTGGTPAQMYPQCAFLASLGMVAMSAEYRTKSKAGTSPRECVIDGKSCLCWIRDHAEELGVDPARLAAGGGSAGGHVAIAAAILPGFDEPGAPKSDPPKLSALILFNPVVDNGPGGYGYDRVKDYYREISPLHNLRAGIPPTLALYGTHDQYVPVATAEKFQSEMERMGNRCEVILYANQKHGFFNYRASGNPYFDQTMAAVRVFLASVGMLGDNGVSQ